MFLDRAPRVLGLFNDQSKAFVSGIRRPTVHRRDRDPLAKEKRGWSEMQASSTLTFPPDESPWWTFVLMPRSWLGLREFNFGLELFLRMRFAVVIAEAAFVCRLRICFARQSTRIFNEFYTNRISFNHRKE